MVVCNFAVQALVNRRKPILLTPSDSGGVAFLPFILYVVELNNRSLLMWF